MKQLFKAAMPLAVTILFAACGNNSEKSTASTDSANHGEHEHMDMDQGKAVKTNVSLKNDKLNAVYQHYVHLTTALINSDAAEAKIASNAIEAGAKEIAGGSNIAATAAKITAAADIEAQRTAYATLSNAFIDLVKKSGVNSDTLYVDFCPMAMNDKGAYWLSAGEEIKNPYFGEKMMTCGEVKETIQ
jgi:major membrane immunogen (membrane-anchored lipoprotein)